MDEDNKKTAGEDTAKNADPAADADSTNSLQAKLAACEKQRDEYLAGWQRAKADFANYKKDEAKRFEDFARFSNTELLRELIEMVDNFDLGLAALEKAGPVEKGIYMIRARLEDLLVRHGTERITIKIGDPFDPSVAEAIAEAESDQPPGTVVEEIEPGYRLYGKILRPARVKVSKGHS